MDSGEQPAERRLSCARGADDGNPLARTQFEVDPVEHVAAVDVRVAHVAGKQRIAVRDAPRRGPSGGTDSMPTRRASDAAPTWISSSQEMRRSTGSASCWA